MHALPCWRGFAGGFVTVATLLVGCDRFADPSKSVAGNWSASNVLGAGSVIDHFEMSLTQNGDRISGTMCRQSGTPPQGIVLRSRDVPVGGKYPNITFTVTGESFSGKFEEDREQIAGNLTGPARGVPLRFFRADSGHCEGARQQ